MKWIVTGGGGFIGANTVKRLLELGHQVVVIDNLSRRGAKANLEWLRTQGGFEFVKQDVRDFSALQSIITRHADADVVLHLAAQVAVTTSVTDPRTDFETNALGTFNLLEAIRQSEGNPIVLYASTNKVYGKMENVEVVQKNGRYQYANLSRGVPESTPLDFHSPYGCSKGTADQYVRDYARIYGLKTIVFRQSCIYGYRQFGIEDQGWVAWFTIASVFDAPLTIYGDGRQVRDVLFVDDLTECYLQAVKNIEQTAGKIYNIGGGPENQLSLLGLLNILGEKLEQPIDISYADWRPGDQRVFVSNIDKARNEFGWYPAYDVEQGIDRLYAWVYQHKDMLISVLGNLL
jgi:CDP-paratose 2-epimerase